MRTEILDASLSKSIQHALEILRSGGLVAFPTDTVYGLGALAFDGAAVRELFAVKDRPDEKAIPILVADPVDLVSVASKVNSLAAALAARFWPGPLTLVVPKHVDLPEQVSAYPTVGVRVPDHLVARKLLQAAGPMAVSSANISGQASSINAEHVRAQLDGRIALILDGGKTPGGVPSTVVECVGEKPVVLRIGPISAAEIADFLGIEL